MIDINARAGENYLHSKTHLRWGTRVPDSGKSDSERATPWDTREDAISAVKMPATLTARVDAWAEAHQMTRSDAIRHLVELGLKTASALSLQSRNWNEIEELAVQQLDQMLDPALPTEERERRIRRLTEGPPEFSRLRIDLPKHEES